MQVDCREVDGKSFCYFPNTTSICFITASVTSFVFAEPPISFVLVWGLLVTFSMACMRPSATLSSSPRPSHLTISAADQKAPTGFAIPCPEMSGAEPWIGSNMDGYCLVGSRFDDGAIPVEPARAAARSDRMSACTRRNATLANLSQTALVGEEIRTICGNDRVH